MSKQRMWYRFVQCWTRKLKVEDTYSKSLRALADTSAGHDHQISCEYHYHQSSITSNLPCHAFFCPSKPTGNITHHSKEGSNPLCSLNDKQNNIVFTNDFSMLPPHLNHLFATCAKIWVWPSCKDGFMSLMWNRLRPSCRWPHRHRCQKPPFNSQYVPQVSIFQLCPNHCGKKLAKNVPRHFLQNNCRFFFQTKRPHSSPTFPERARFTGGGTSEHSTMLSGTLYFVNWRGTWSNFWTNLVLLTFLVHSVKPIHPGPDAIILSPWHAYGWWCRSGPRSVWDLSWSTALPRHHGTDISYFSWFFLAKRSIISVYVYVTIYTFLEYLFKYTGIIKCSILRVDEWMFSTMDIHLPTQLFSFPSDFNMFNMSGCRDINGPVGIRWCRSPRWTWCTMASGTHPETTAVAECKDVKGSTSLL